MKTQLSEPSNWRCTLGWLFLPVVLLCPSELWAHQVSAVAAEAKFFANGLYSVRISLEVEESPDPEQNDQISAEEAVLTYLGDALSFRFDHSPVETVFSTPSVRTEGTRRQGSMEFWTEAEGRIPKGARSFSARLSPETDVALVLLVEKNGVRERRARTIFAGETSRPVDLTALREEVMNADPWETKEGEGLPRSFVKSLSLTMQSSLVLMTMAAWVLGIQSAAQFFREAILMSLGFSAGVLLQFLAPGVSALPSMFFSMGILLFLVDNFLPPGWWKQLRILFALLAGCLMATGEFSAFTLSYVGGQLGAMWLMLLVLWMVLGAFWDQAWYDRAIRKAGSVGLLILLFLIP